MLSVVITSFKTKLSIHLPHYLFALLLLRALDGYYLLAFNFSGDFVFAISSADGSELWLSTDDDPKHSRKIAYLGEVKMPHY